MPVTSKVFSTKWDRPFLLSDRAEGVYVYDTDGKQYLDACGSAFTVTVGHCVPEIAEAICRQAKSLHFLNYKHFANVPAERLAERIIHSTAEGFSHVFFATSGSEAVEAAMKFARVYQRDRGAGKRYKVISGHGHFHGNAVH